MKKLKFYLGFFILSVSFLFIFSYNSKVEAKENKNIVVEKNKNVSNIKNIIKPYNYNIDIFYELNFWYTNYLNGLFESEHNDLDDLFNNLRDYKKENIGSELKNENKNSVLNSILNSLQEILSNYNTYQEQTKAHANDIPFLTKNYILHGQGYYAGMADLLQWNDQFLNLLDDTTINKVYQQYLLDKNPEGDIRKFAEYLTRNAPIRNDWQDLIKKKLEKQYDNVGNIKFELLDPKKFELPNSKNTNMYGIYLTLDGAPQGEEYNGILWPFIIVDARTGSFY